MQTLVSGHSLTHTHTHTHTWSSHCSTLSAKIDAVTEVMPQVLLK